jgi:hypothetical protein
MSNGGEYEQVTSERVLEFWNKLDQGQRERLLESDTDEEMVRIATDAGLVARSEGIPEVGKAEFSVWADELRKIRDRGNENPIAGDDSN